MTGGIGLSGCVGLLLNTQKPKALELGRRLINWGQKERVNILVPPHEASILGHPGISDEEWRNSVDFAVVIGGDGTFLRAARYVVGCSIPLYGINVGNLGFLAAGDPENAEKDILSIIDGNYSVQSRSLLRGAVWRGERKVHELYAVNDLVVTKGSFARLVFIRLHVNGKALSVLPADGLIVSTPTGSTAYSLSVGGPIVPPHVPCFVVAPICAHTLYARPVILGDTDEVTIVPEGDNRDLMLTQDGQLGYELLPGDRITVSLAKDRSISTISLPGRDYYDLLQQKLNWGKSQTEVVGE